ncbi:hypothetical protein R3I94_010864 [Phoxinus phoxinus]
MASSSSLLSRGDKNLNRTKIRGKALQIGCHGSEANCLSDSRCGAITGNAVKGTHIQLGCGVLEIEAKEEKGSSEGFVSENLRNIVSSGKDASDEYWIRCLCALTLKWCCKFGSVWHE